MTDLEIYLEDFDYEGEDIASHIGEIADSTDIKRVQRLLEETKEAYQSGLLRPAVITLWCAASEQLKEFLYLYDKKDLSNAGYIGNIEDYSDLNDEKDFKLVQAAEDLQLLDSSNLPLVQGVYKARNACAHGDKVQLTEEKFGFCLATLNEAIFSKSNEAGVNAEVLLRILASGRVPREYFKAVETFDPEEQSRLVRKLYEMRKDLPPERMDVRDPYLEGFSQAERNQRDAVLEAFEIIWGKMDEDVKRSLIKKSFQDLDGREQIQQFLIAYGMPFLDGEKKNILLERYFEGHSVSDFRDQNDVAITLVRAGELEGIDEERVLEIWKYCRQKYGPQNNPEKIREYFKEVVESLGSEEQRLIVDSIIGNLEQLSEDRDFSSEEDDMEDSYLSLINFKYIVEYFDRFEEDYRHQMLDALEESEFYKFEDVQDFVESGRQ